ncbi:MAG: COG4315 family predicted lipoprotein [Ferrimicrobium sp.]
MLVVGKLLRGVAVVGVFGVVLSACHFSNGQYGPASAGAALQPTNGPAGASGSGNSATAKLLGGGLSVPKTASTYDGAGFPIPDYGPVSYHNYVNGDPKYPATIGVRNSAYGQILTTQSGYTLYIRLGDEFRDSKCFKICLDAFPPELTNGAPQAAPGILAADLGVLTANNSWEQVSYGGRPLYRYRLDTKPGEINAEGKGGIWYVVGVNGLPITKPLSRTSATKS